MANKVRQEMIKQVRAANEVRQDMIKQGQCVCVCVCVYGGGGGGGGRVHYHILLIYNYLPLTDVHNGTLEYFLDEYTEDCSINIFLASYPSYEVVSA